MILTVYGRMFSLWMYAAIAPIPLSTFAGEPTSSVGKNFIRSYAGVCLQGVVIALSCIIFSAISSSPPAVDTGASVVTAVWTYVGELAFNHERISEPIADAICPSSSSEIGSLP